MTAPPQAPASAPARLSARMHALYASGRSFAAIAAALNGRGERAIRGGRWFASSVRLFMLRTPPARPTNESPTRSMSC
jgi:hypothetical protein